MRIAERMEIELTATGHDAEKVKQGLMELAVWIREEHPRYAGLVSDVLLKAGSGEAVDGKHRVTIKATWTPEQWSTFIEQFLAP